MSSQPGRVEKRGRVEARWLRKWSPRDGRAAVPSPVRLQGSGTGREEADRSGNPDTGQDGAHSAGVDRNFLELHFKDKVKVKELALSCMLRVLLRLLLRDSSCPPGAGGWEEGMWLLTVALGPVLLLRDISKMQVFLMCASRGLSLHLRHAFYHLRLILSGNTASALSGRT